MEPLGYQTVPRAQATAAAAVGKNHNTMNWIRPVECCPERVTIAVPLEMDSRADVYGHG